MTTVKVAPLDNTQVTTALLKLLELASARLLAPVGRTSLVPGTQMVEDDCCNGQLWARVLNIAPWVANTGNGPRGNPECFVSGWNITAALGTVRCVHGISEKGVVPTAEQLNQDFNLISSDAEQLSKALLQDFPQHVMRFQLNTWAPSGPQALCAGGEWQFTFSLPYCI